MSREDNILSTSSLKQAEATFTPHLTDTPMRTPNILACLHQNPYILSVKLPTPLQPSLEIQTRPGIANVGNTSLPSRMAPPEAASHPIATYVTMKPTPIPETLNPSIA